MAGIDMHNFPQQDWRYWPKRRIRDTANEFVVRISSQPSLLKGLCFD